MIQNISTRRTFLQGSAAISGGLMIGFSLPVAAQEAPKPTPYVLKPNAFIHIDADGKVAFQIPQEEMGQGVYTSLSQLLADELDVAFDQVTPLPAPPDDMIYGSPQRHRQSTGGSTSIRNFYTALRQVGASGRAMMVEAAARQWGVKAETLRTENGMVIDDAHGGRKLSYGALAPAAAKLDAPQNPTLKTDAQLKYIGKPMHRLDSPSKVNGSAQYGIDVRMDGLKVATLAASPVVGGKVKHVDDSKLMPGVQLVVLDDIVAVVASNFWTAKKGLDALKITWDGGPNGHLDSKTLMAELRDIAAKKGVTAAESGDADKALGKPGGPTRLDATYQVPFLAHAPMEPQNFTVHAKKDGTCEMWGGSQVQTAAWRAAATVLNIAPEKVTYHNFMLGGGFGRRLDVDMVVKATRIAQKVDGPVKVIWTREEDMTQDMYRPAYRNVMAASLGKDGKIKGWTHRIAGGSVGVRMSGKPLVGGLDRGSVDGALDNIYGAENFRVEYIQAEPRALNVGYWRGVAPNNSIFAIESFIDELALKAGKDPLTFRLDNLGGQPRLHAALTLAAQKANWGSKLGPRRGRGICAQFAFGTYIATIADAEVDENGEVKIHRYTSAVDAGHVVNPDGLTAQLQGGLIFSSTAALYGKITVKDGRVQQTNFNNYRMVRMSEAPAIDIHIVPSTQAPGGMGEPGCSAGQPALVNAIAAATGVRLRSMPIDRDLLAGRKTV